MSGVNVKRVRGRCFKVHCSKSGIYKVGETEVCRQHVRALLDESLGWADLPLSSTTPYSAKEIEAVAKALNLPPENLRDLVRMATTLAIEPIVLARAIASIFPEGHAPRVAFDEEGVCCRRGCGNTETEIFYHESYTRACADHADELRLWLGKVG